MGKLWRADNLYSFLYRTDLFLYEYDKWKHSSIGRSFHSSGFFFPPFPFSATFWDQKEVGHNPDYENKVVDVGQATKNFQFGGPQPAVTEHGGATGHHPAAGQQSSWFLMDHGTRVASVSVHPTCWPAALWSSPQPGLVHSCTTPVDLYVEKARRCCC